MGQRRSFRTFLITFTLIFMLGMSIEVFSQVINSLRATNTSQLVVDNNTNGLADGGDIIQYTVQIANCSPAGIGGVNYQSDIDPNTVLIPSSITVTTQNTTLCGGGGDTPPPAPTAVPPPTIPIVTTTTPANGATEVALNSNVDITFSEAVTVTGNWVQMVCTTSGTFDITSANLTVTGGPITYTLDPNVDLVVGETCAVTVFAAQVTDSEGINPTSDYAFGFVTETPPTITATTPANGAVAVPTTDDIVITFDEPVTVTAASFTLECPATVPFAGGFAVSGSGTSIITVNPTGNLPAGTICEVDVIAANTSDLDANDPPDLLDGNGDLTEGDDYTFSFTTDVDAAPTVTNIVPATGAVSVANSTNITITFSESVFINGAGDFSLDCGGAPQGYTVTIPAVLPNDTLTVEIDPTTPLPDASLCTVTVFTSVTDSDLNDPPNNMAANFVSTFTTEAPPAVTTTTPADLATGVSTSANIVVNFDEPVTATETAFTLVCNAVNIPLLAGEVTGTGTATITINPTANLPANANCVVTVVALNVADVDPIDPPDNMLADYVFSFDTVADTAPIASSPLDGVTGVATASNIVINFNEPVDVTAGAFVVECPVGSPIAFTIIPALPTTNQTSITLDPSVNLPATTTCTVTVLQANVTDTDTDEPPDNMVADYIFTFDTIVDLAPTVNQAGIAPASTSTGANSASLNNPVSTTPTITIPFSEAVDVATGAFTLACPGAVGVTVIPGLPNTNQTSFDVSPTAPLTAGANCTLTVVAANVADTDVDDPPNLMVTNFTLSFSVDNAPAETLTETEVGGVFQDVTGAGASNVDLDSNIQITFNEAVTVTFPANGLQCPGGTNIPVTVTTNNATTIVLNPDVNLPLNQPCVLAIPAANINDVDTADAPDNPAVAVNHTFQTANDNAPTVTTNPVAGGGNIAVNSNITVTFNEPVTLTGAWFDLDCSISGTRTSTGELTGTGINIIENTPDLVYTIDPTADFASGDVCTITIDSANVVDNDIIDGPNELDGDASLDVANGDPDDYIAVFSTTDMAPQVNSTTPTGVNPTVDASQAVTLNFSEAVNIAVGAFSFDCPTPIAGGFNTSVALPASFVTTITLTPVNPLPFGATCTVTANSTLVVDSDPVDPPNQLDGDGSNDIVDGDADNFTMTFTVDAQATETQTQVEVAGVPTNAGGAVNVDLDTNIVVTFSEAVNANLTSFALDCGGAVAFTVLGTGTNTITVDPTPAFLPINTLCDFDIIAANITDVDAADAPDLLDTDVNYTFTTVNDNPPSVTSAEAEVGSVFTALPLGGGVFADTDTDLRVTFSEAVTVTGNWAELDCTVSGIQNVTLGLGVTDADPVYTFNPATNLTPGEDCLLIIFAPAVADDDIIDPPNLMLVDAAFTFTVADTPPQVDTATSTPINGAIVANNTTVTFDFTEMVDIAGGAISFECNATPVAFTPALPLANVTSITLTPTVALTNGAACIVTLESTLITDDDVVDGANELDGSGNGDVTNGDADDYVLNFTVDAPPQVFTATVEVAGVPTFLPLAFGQVADVDTNIVVNFNENIDATVAGVTLDCGAGAIPFAGLPVANNTSITVNPTSDLPGNASCTITMVFTEISDTDAFDPPNLFDGNFDLTEGPSLGLVFTTAGVANDDAFTVTPHLTYTSSAVTLSVRDNDNPISATITGFGDTLGNANANATGTAVAITGGTVVLNADGTFIFYPATGFSNTSTSFFYTVTGGDTAQVTINIQNQEFVWFVDNSPTAPPAPFTCSGAYIGTQACPSADIATVSALDTANDTIFVAQGSYTCNDLLENGERFVGDGSTSTLAAVSGVTPVAGSSFPAFTGTDPILTSGGNCLVLVSNNTIRGIRIDNTGNYALASSVNIGTALITETNITGTGGLFNFLGGGTLNAAFETLSSSAHSGRVINLNNMAGSVSNTGGAITNNANADVIGVDGGTVSLTLFSTVSKTGGLSSLLSVSSGHATGTLNFLSGISQSSATGSGIQLSDADGNYIFNGNLAISAGTAGVNIVSGSSGTINFISAGSSITGVTGISFRMNNSPAPVDYAGSITHTSQANRGIEIINSTGTINFTGNLQIGTVGSPMLSAVGVFLDATGNINPISFANLNIITGVGSGLGSQAFVSQTSGRIAVTTGNIDCNGNIGVGNHCFDVSDTISDGVTFASILSDHDDLGENGGAIFLNNTSGTFTFQNFVRMTGTNTIIVQATNFGTLNVGTVTPGIIALNGAAAVNLNTGALNFNAESVSAFSGATNGILIQNTTGSFTVNGTGVAGSGGVIANTIGADGSTNGIGIYMNNATNITLNDMQLNDHPNFAVAGNSVTNFVMDSTVINGVNGNNASFNEGGIQFGGLFGTSVISNSTVNGAFEYPIFIQNTSGASNITVSGTTIGLNDAANGTDGMTLLSTGTSDMTAFVTGNNFIGARQFLLRASNLGTAQLRLTVNGGNQFHNTHPSIVQGGILIENLSTGFVRLLFTGNTQRGALTDALWVLNEGPGTLDSTITNNTFGVPATPNSSTTNGSSILVRIAQNAGQVTTNIANNFVHQYNTMGIYMLLGSPSALAGGAGSYRATVTGNTVSNPGAFALNGIHLNSGNVGGDTFTSCINITGNNMVGAGFNLGATDTDFRLRQRQSTTVTIPGYLGANNDNAAVVAYVQSLNPGAETGSVANTVPTGGGFINGAACALPVLP